jgi:uncharacterized membrane protein
MEKLVKPGRIIFAVGMIILAIICYLSKDFIVGRPPAWPSSFTINPALAYISGTAILAASIAILFRKNGGFAAMGIALLIFVLSVLRHLPHFMNDWANAYKSLALFGGSLIIAVSFQDEMEGKVAGPFISKSIRDGFVQVGSILIGIFFLACGYAHFKFAEFVNTLIPGFIPFHSFWTYFCGVCLFAGGLGLIFPQTRSRAALLSAIMVGGWFILLHVPRFIANSSDPSDRMGLGESFTFVGIFLVLSSVARSKR